MVDLMKNYQQKNERDVWDKIGNDTRLGSARQDYNSERANNFMGDAERIKL